MNSLRLLARQVAHENRTFWRNPAAAFFTVFFPLMFLVVFNLLFGENQIDVHGGVSDQSTFYVPAITAFAVISACYTNIAMMVTGARDRGLLKRLRGTPLPPWVFLAGRIIHATLVALLLTAVIAIAGALFYDVDIPTNTMPALVVTLAIGAASFCALGLAMTALIPNADAAPALVNASVLPLFFISNVFIRLTDAPGWLLAIGDVFPVRHFSEALQAVFNPYQSGAGFAEPWRLAIIAAWGVFGLVLALRFFSWEPRC
jgi:ABC-2 type transport system permease protein